MDPFDQIQFDDAPDGQSPSTPPPAQGRRPLLLWLVAAGLGILILPLSQIVQTVRADNARLSGELVSAQTAVVQTPTVGKDVASVQSTLSALQQQSNVLSPFTKNLQDKQLNWVDAASTIADYDHAHLALTGLEQHDNRLVITGRADTDTAVMAYAQALEDSGKFSRVVVQSISGVSTPFTTPTLSGASETTPMPIYESEPQKMTFSVPQQAQVFVFLAKAGRFYQVLTTNLAPGVDTSMTVTLDNGATFANDDAKPGVLSSEVDFQSPDQNMNATVRVENMGRFGPNSTYQIVVKEIIPTPTPKGGSGGSGGSGSSAATTPPPVVVIIPTNAPTSTPAPTRTPRPTKTPVPTVAPTADQRDAYEPDQPTPTSIGVGETQHRNFYPSGDVDAAAFAAKKNRYYIAQTANLVPGVDTAMTVTLGASSWQNDDANPSQPNSYASLVCFQAPANGSATVTVTNNTGQFGPNLTYDLSVQEVAAVLPGSGSLTFDTTDTLGTSTPDPATLTQSLNLTSSVTTNWTAAISPGTSWLTLNAYSGTTSSTVTVNVDPTGKADGQYTGAITVSWANGCSTQIPVTMNVNPSASVQPLTRFARTVPVRSEVDQQAGTPGPVQAVDFAILVELPAVQP